jgi:hypothetical protein
MSFTYDNICLPHFNIFSVTVHVFMRTKFYKGWLVGPIRCLLDFSGFIQCCNVTNGWVCSFRGRDRNPLNSKHTASAHTGTPGRHWPRRERGWMETMQTALTRIMTARLAQHRRGRYGNPYRNSIQQDPRTFEFAAGMGMDGNHGNSTCTHQHLASQRNSIYSTISTLHFRLLPCTWTLEATNMFEVLTQTQFKVIF